MSKSITELASEWHSKLLNCHYAGEIYLNTEELKDLSREFVLKEDANLNEERQYETALLVLAVNCAYHFYDDEGFWKHFCSLLKCKNTTGVQDTLGEVIERRLNSLGLLRIERKGPFRYVGAILEQCGLSRRYIEPFARIIKEMKNNMGIDHILSMSHSDFQDQIDASFCSRYLKKFLTDNAGWQFTRQVLRLVELYEEGALTLNDLGELPGFQPDFWEEFFRYMEITKKKKSKSKVLHFKPRLVFLANKNCIGLQFPTLRFIQNVVEPLGVGWKYPVTVLEENEMWSEQYSGYVSDTDGAVNRWRIKGWLPDGQPVLFDNISGMVDRNTIIKPGFYYLLAPFEYQPECSIIQDLGQVKAYGRWKYRAYNVKLDKGVLLQGYSVLETEPDEIKLSWLEPDKYRLKYSSDNYLDIFVGSIPEIHISDFSTIEKNITGLFYDIGDGTSRIRTLSDLAKFREEVRQRAPVRGRLWLSNITRNRFSSGNSISELEFSLFPKCSINYQERLYGYNEEALIIFNGQSLSLQVEGCRQMEDSEQQYWTIPASIYEAIGVVIYEDITAGIRVPVCRAGIFYSGGKRIRYCCLSELDKDASLIVKGYPDSKGLLQLTASKDAAISVQFDRKGIAIINTRELLEMARAIDCHVSEVIIAGDELASTGTILINLSELKQRIYQGELFAVYLKSEKNVTTILDTCLKICKSPIPGLALNRLPEYCKEFKDWIVSMMACASIFDNSFITVGGVVPDWINLIDDLETRNLLLFYKQQTTTNIFGNNQINKPVKLNLGVLPMVERWHQAMKNITYRDLFEGKKAVLEEWAADIKGKGPFHSQIANQQGGSNLSRAWRLYLQKRHQKAIDLINNIESGSDLVLDLKNFLHTLLLLRMARIKAAKKLASNAGYHTELFMLNELLKYLTSVLTGNPVVLQENAGNWVSVILPLDNDDKVLLENVAVSGNQMNNDLLSGCQNLNDWLLILFIVSRLESGEKRSLLASKLLGMKDRIPASPDKSSIIDKLNTYIRGN